MFRKYTMLLIILGCLAAPAIAQDNTTGKAPKKSCSCGFSSINQAGLLAGEKSNYFSLQTVNGFRYKTWFAGVGIGLDTYHTITLPLFLDIRKNLLQRTNTPFLYADGGIQFLTDKTKTKSNGYLKEEYSTGAYYDFGLGYHIGLKNKQGLLMSAGYSMKRLQYDSRTQVVCVTFPCPGYTDNYNFTLNRLSFKVGYRF